MSTIDTSITTSENDELNTKKRSLEDENIKDENNKDKKLKKDNTTTTTTTTTTSPKEDDEKEDKEEEEEQTNTTDINDYDEKKVIFKGKFKSWKKHSRLFATDEVVKGLLICCDSLREANSIGELLPFLNAFADKYYPKEEIVPTITTTEGEEPKKKKRFELINSGCGGIYFISMPTENVDPIDFMNCIFVDIYKRQMIKKNLPIDFIDNDIIKNFPESTKKMLENADKNKFIADKVLNRVIFTSKVIPILRTFRASEVDMYPIMREVIKEQFKNQQGKTFAIEIRTRNNSTLDKAKVIKDIAEMVDPTIKVDLKNPDITIVIEIIKSSVVASVIPQYKKLFKLNLREVIACNLNKGPTQPKPNSKKQKQKLKLQKEKEEKEKQQQQTEQQVVEQNKVDN